MSNKKIGILISVNLDSALTHDLFSRVLDSFKTYCEQSGYILSFIKQESLRSLRTLRTLNHY